MFLKKFLFSLFYIIGLCLVETKLDDQLKYPQPKSRQLNSVLDKEESELNSENLTEQVLLLNSDFSADINPASKSELIQEPVQWCGQTAQWVLQNRRIFFMSTAEGHESLEILIDSKLNNNLLKFMDEIGDMLNCSSGITSESKDEAEFAMFPGFFHLRCNGTCTDALTDEDKLSITGALLEHYFSNMPRSHYGFDPPETDFEHNHRCLDENGYDTKRLAKVSTCMSFWIADKIQTLNENKHVGYYSGRLLFNRVDQHHFLIDGKKSIPYYFYENNRLNCYMTKRENATEYKMGEVKNTCETFLSVQNYAMFCCCFFEMGGCHMPNPKSYHYLDENEKRDNISCAYGDFIFDDHLKHPKGGFSTNASWLDSSQLSDIKSKVMGKRCMTVYNFTEQSGTQKKAVVMSMRSSTFEECPEPRSDAFLCELQRTICPLEKPTYEVLNQFSVKCCCGGHQQDDDLCNLDFLSHKVLDSFEEVFNNKLCSYSKHHHRLFSKFRDEEARNKIFCVVNYDLGLQKVVYLMEGNNFDNLFDPKYISHRSESSDSHLILGYPLNVNDSCKEHGKNPYTNDDLGKPRVYYVHKCNPLTKRSDGQEDKQCDLQVETNIKQLFNDNKDKAMRKCLNYKSGKVVYTKEEVQEQITSTANYLHADQSHFCYSQIVSNIETLIAKQIIKDMKFGHTIEAGPLDSTNKKNYQQCMIILDYLRQHNDKKYCKLLDSTGSVELSGNTYTNATYFCCCFVGVGWEDCDLNDRILHYVESYDLKMESKAIRETAKGTGPAKDACYTEGIEGKGVQKNITDKGLENCIHPIGCFRLQDLDMDNAGKPKRFEENENNFPILAKFSKKYMSAPATSVAKESIFSLARSIYDYKTTNLDPKKAEMLMYLNKVML